MLETDNDNNNQYNAISLKLKSIIDKVILEKTYEEGKNKLLEYFKYIISDENIIKLSLKTINNIIILKINSKIRILSVLPLICQINPVVFLNHINIILSIFQTCINKDKNSLFYSQIYKYFGDISQILLSDLENINYKEKDYNKNLLLAYDKFKIFCISNINTNDINSQICGILCLTSFIENCSYNYTNKKNLKYIFENLSEKIKKEEFPAKLELLNCFLSLIFCSEEKYLPYAKETLNLVIKFINKKEWLIKKFSLNIIYTMLFYYKEEIMEKKEYIIECFKKLKNENNSEIKEMIEKIYDNLNDEDDINDKYIKTSREFESPKIYEQNINTSYDNNNKKINENIKKIVKKLKSNNSSEKSRNLMDSYFMKKKKKSSSISLKKSNNISLTKKIIKNKNYGFNSIEKYNKIINIKKQEINLYKTYKNSEFKNKLNKCNNSKINAQKTSVKKINKLSSLNKSKDNNKTFIIENNRNIHREKNLRNNNSLEFNKNRNLLNHGINIIKRTKKLNKDKNRLKSDIIKNYNKDIINHIIKNQNNMKSMQFSNKFIKNLKSDFSDSKNEQTQNFISERNNNISFVSNNNSTISIEKKFIEYKSETNKIINDLKTQVKSLKISLNNFEEIEKNKKNLIFLVKNKNFEKAFETAINIGNIQEIYYVIKNYLLNNNKGINLSNKILAKIMEILCKDILLCESLGLIIMFIIKNICEKNIYFNKQLNKVVYDVFSELYNKRKELCLLKKDINYILKITNYFKNKI